MEELIPITQVPSIQCGKLTCTEPALSGQVFCYEHTFPKIRNPREWEDLGNGAWRRKPARTGG